MNKKLKYILTLESFLNKKSDFLLESQFASKDLENVLELISNWLYSKTNVIYSYNVELEHIRQNNHIELYGIRYLGSDGSMFRINWETLPKKSSTRIQSIDFWEDGVSYPKYKLNVLSLNIVQLLGALSSFLKTSSDYLNYFYDDYIDAEFYTNDTEDNILTPNFKMDESLSEDENRLYLSLKSKIVVDKDDVTKEDKKKFVSLHMKQNGFGDIVDDIFDIEEIGNEENIDEIENSIIEDFDKKIMTKIPMDQKFKDFEFFVKAVATGIRQSIVATGTPGVGKSHTVSKVMSELGLVQNKDWVLIKGTASPFGMYQTFCEYPKNYIIVFDDCDSVFRNEDGLNLLKGALDSSPIRTVNWKSKTTFSPIGLTETEIRDRISEGKYPNNIEVTSGAIFLTNIERNELLKNVKLKAIISRAGSPIDLTFEDVDILSYMESVLDKVDIGDIPKEYKRVVFEAMVKAHEEGILTAPLNFRTLLNMIKSKRAYDMNIFRSKRLGQEIPYDNNEWIRLATNYS
jgi:hypothetical protein